MQNNGNHGNGARCTIRRLVVFCIRFVCMQCDTACRTPWKQKVKVDRKSFSTVLLQFVDNFRRSFIRSYPVPIFVAQCHLLVGGCGLSNSFNRRDAISKVDKCRRLVPTMSFSAVEWENVAHFRVKMALNPCKILRFNVKIAHRGTCQLHFNKFISKYEI